MTAPTLLNDRPAHLQKDSVGVNYELIDGRPLGAALGQARKSQLGNLHD